MNCKHSTRCFIKAQKRLSVNTAQFCLGENPINRWLSMKKSARRADGCFVAKHDKLNFNYALSSKNVHLTQTTLALDVFKTD